MQLAFRSKAQLFHELAELTQSGIPFAKALSIMGRDSGQRLGRWARKAEREWTRHRSVQAALRASGLAERDVAVVEAGESSGRMPEVFRELSEYYEQLARARQALIQRSLYPLFLIHFAILLPSIPFAILNGGWTAYLGSVIPALFVLYLGLAAILLGFSFLLKLLASSSAAVRIVRLLPVLGGFFRDWSAWSFAMVASLCLRTGGGLLNAFVAAGRGSGNAEMDRGSRDAAEAVRAGQGLAEAYLPVLPAELLRAIEIGEHSGKLDLEMTRAAHHFQQRSLLKLDLAAEWIPRLLYIAVVLFTGWQILSMAMGIGSSFNEVLSPESY